MSKSQAGTSRDAFDSEEDDFGYTHSNYVFQNHITLYITFLFSFNANYELEEELALEEEEVEEEVEAEEGMDDVLAPTADPGTRRTRGSLVCCLRTDDRLLPIRDLSA
jgi:hypothetical protein